MEQEHAMCLSAKLPNLTTVSGHLEGGSGSLQTAWPCEIFNCAYLFTFNPVNIVLHMK